MRVFISYSREDQEFAKRLDNNLGLWNHDTWIDIRNIPKGAYWTEEVNKGLEQCEIIIGILSPAAIKSRNVRNELDWAIAHPTKRLILLMYRQCALPMEYISINYIDFTKGEKVGFDELKEALGMLPKSTINAAQVVNTPQRQTRFRKVVSIIIGILAALFVLLMISFRLSQVLDTNSPKIAFGSVDKTPTLSLTFSPILIATPSFWTSTFIQTISFTSTIPVTPLTNTSVPTTRTGSTQTDTSIPSSTLKSTYTFTPQPTNRPTFTPVPPPTVTLMPISPPTNINQSSVYSTAPDKTFAAFLFEFPLFILITIFLVLLGTSTLGTNEGCGSAIAFAWPILFAVWLWTMKMLLPNLLEPERLLSMLILTALIGFAVNLLCFSNLLEEMPYFQIGILLFSLCLWLCLSYKLVEALPLFPLF